MTFPPGEKIKPLIKLNLSDGIIGLLSFNFQPMNLFASALKISIELSVCKRVT
jgi:hypothetical protein